MDSKKNKDIDRREFIELSVKGTAAISLFSLPVLSSCANRETSKTVLAPAIMIARIVAAGR
ncbi:MAG: hypothetical protein P1U56_26730 [Saprospiraceae bacterium]|nr:hypothetical protein [Saprospiraceae bacterium]